MINGRLGPRYWIAPDVPRAIVLGTRCLEVDDGALQPFSGHQGLVRGDNIVNYSETIERFPRGGDGPEKSADHIRWCDPACVLVGMVSSQTG